MKSIKILTIAIIASLLYSCTDDDDASPSTPITPNEEELITTVRLNFMDTSGVTTTYEFNDPDGDGGNAPVIDTIILDKSETYDLNTEFLDASDPNDIEDITTEIRDEDDEHLVCYTTSAVDGLSVSIIDTDGTYDVGLSAVVLTTDTASSINGTLKVTLKHQPGVKDGTCAPGETDVEVDFPVRFN